MRCPGLFLCLVSLLLTTACGASRTEDDAQRDAGSPSTVSDMARGDQGGETGDMTTLSRPDMTSPDLSTADMDGSGDAGGVCVDVTVYQDGDGDGYGEGGEMISCLKSDEAAPAGFARARGDCRDNDPLAYQGAEGVCNDNVDDDCDGADETCPTSQPDQMSVPSWDCTGSPPENVYAWARFEEGGGYFKDGGCFVFFEGKKDIFYAQRVNLAPASDNCNETSGCVCPSLNGAPSYDRRLYAFTTSGTPDDCPTIALRDHGGEDQPVSNACRKYLYQLHRYDIPYSHIASSLDALERRLQTFSTIEIACLEDAPHKNLPFKTLLAMDITYSNAFQKKS